MKNHFNISKYSQLNFLVALVGTFVVGIFQMILGEDKNIFLFAGMAFCTIYFTGIINFYLHKKVKNRLLFYGLSFLFCAIVYFLFFIPLSQAIGLNWKPTKFRLIGILLLTTFLLNLSILMLQRFFLLIQEKNQSDLEILKLKTANAEASNFLLRQQIEPHFLFNALSNLKALYNENSENGERYLVHLANFLRSSISEKDKSISKLENELNFLSDYLEMQKIRFGESLQYAIRIDEVKKTKSYLPSFSLQMLVENAIKHNDFTEEDPLRIVIENFDDELTVCNSLRQKVNPESSTKLGLANLQERYQLISGDYVSITRSETRFCVTLKLLSDENINH